MDTILVLAAIEISDSMRRTAVKVTPVKGKVDLNSSDYKSYSSFCDYAIRRRTGLLKAWETKYVDVSTVCYMDEALDEHMSTLYESHITLSDGSSKLAQQRRRYARTPKSNKGYYIHQLVATMIQG